MTFDEWWKENGIELATFVEKSAARKGWKAGANSENEACAKVCEYLGREIHGEGRDDSEAFDCADAIRARMTA